jgi:hypothetical protein
LGGGGEGRTKAHVESTCAQAVLKNASNNGYCATLKTSQKRALYKGVRQQAAGTNGKCHESESGQRRETRKREAKRRRWRAGLGCEMRPEGEGAASATTYKMTRWIVRKIQIPERHVGRSANRFNCQPARAPGNGQNFISMTGKHDQGA